MHFATTHNGYTTEQRC